MTISKQEMQNTCEHDTISNLDTNIYECDWCELAFAPKKAHAAEVRREAEIERDGYRFDYEALQSEGYDFIQELVDSHKLLALEIEQLGDSNQ